MGAAPAGITGETNGGAAGGGWGTFIGVALSGGASVDKPIAANCSPAGGKFPAKNERESIGIGPTFNRHAIASMHKCHAIFVALTFGALASAGQTNSPAPRQWFSLPSSQLRPLTSGSAASEPGLSRNLPSASLSFDVSPRPGKPYMLAETQIAAAPDQETDTGKSTPTHLPGTMSLNSSLSEADLRMYRMLEESGYLKRPREKPDNVFARVANSIFEPTPIRIGKTTVACSVITALKKKNPLCLLNPMVLNISW